MVRLFLKKNGVIIVTIIFLGYLVVNGYVYEKELLNGTKYCDAVKQCLAEKKEYCPSVDVACKIRPYSLDSTTVFFNILVLEGFGKFFSIELFSPLLIIMVTTYWFHQNLKSGNFKNELTRMSYKNFLKKNYKRILKIGLILPLMLVVLYILSYTISTGFQMSQDMITGKDPTSSIDLIFRNKVPIYLLVMLINIYLNSLFYSNLALITAKKFKNPIISIICAYLIFFAITFFFEVFLNAIFYHLFGITVFTWLTLLNFYAYDGVKSLTAMVFLALLLWGITGYINYKYYKNKEEVIIDSEK